MIELLSNPIIASVIVLCALCLLKVNVLISLLIAAIAGGLIGHMTLTNVMSTLIGGMGGNSETALSYILLGAFATAISHTGLAGILSRKIAGAISHRKFLLIWIFAAMAVMSQNLIPVHIAFIPILVPPLLVVMNRLKVDRRSVACALAFGLKTPYIAVPAGFGLIFQGLIADNMTQNGMAATKADIWQSTWILGVAMLVAMLIAVYVSYRKDRSYLDTKLKNSTAGDSEDNKLKFSHYVTLFSAFVTLAIQLLTESLPLGALCGLGIIFTFKAVNFKHMDQLVDGGIGLMGYIAFIMLVAAGYAEVIKATGAVDALVKAAVPYMHDSKIIATLVMLFVGLFITMGIGTSFGTIPILAVLYVPICISMDFSISSTVIVIAAAAALGDAGSPASDTTLGPTAGLNADWQHNHISDTCIPTFIHYNTALVIAAVLAVAVIG